LHQLVARGRLSHDLEARAAQQRDDPLAHDQAVIGDHYAHEPGSLIGARAGINLYRQLAKTAAASVSKPRRRARPLGTNSVGSLTRA
jgi:hypothetical protein